MRSEELELERPHAFLRRERAVQRAGVASLTLFVFAGAAGAFGDGPLSRTATEGGTLVRYERFTRASAPTTIAISVATTAADGAPVRIRIDRALVDNLDFLEVRPNGALKMLDAEGAWLEAPAAGGRGEVELHYKPRRAGILRSLVAPQRGEPAQVWQLTYF